MCHLYYMYYWVDFFSIFFPWKIPHFEKIWPFSWTHEDQKVIFCKYQRSIRDSHVKWKPSAYYMYLFLEFMYLFFFLSINLKKINFFTCLIVFHWTKLLHMQRNSYIGKKNPKHVQMTFCTFKSVKKKSGLGLYSQSILSKFDFSL